MAVLTQGARLGVQETDPVELHRWRDEGEVQAVIRAAYQQVFGNEYLMNSQRLSSAESLLRRGEITVRDFVRVLAKSEVYREKFLYPNAQVRFIELNYKHLLGRAPYDADEIAYHVDLYNSEGYEAEIDAYIDSVEYQESFGDNIVPYYRGFQTTRGQKTVGFNRMFGLYRGVASSDRAQNRTKGRLDWEVSRNLPSAIVPPDGNKALAGTDTGDRAGRYRIQYVQNASPAAARVRQACRDTIVPYDRLSSELQRLARRGSKVVRISLA